MRLTPKIFSEHWFCNCKHWKELKLDIINKNLFTFWKCYGCVCDYYIPNSKKLFYTNTKKDIIFVSYFIFSLNWG